jgi:hypothetical protein
LHCVDVAASYPSELGIPELKPNLLIFRNSLPVLNSFFQKAAEFAETQLFVFAEKKGIRVLASVCAAAVARMTVTGRGHAFMVPCTQRR